MADQPDVFKEQEQPSAEVPAQPSGDPADQNPTKTPEDIFADRLASIKNPEGAPKYDSIEKALDGLANAQDYIPQLKSQLAQKDEELATLKQALEKVGSVEDVVNRLTAARDQEEGDGAPPAQTSGLDEQQVQSLFERMLQERTQAETLQGNLKTVNETLQQVYGDKAQEVVKAKASELGITLQDLKELSSKTPKAVLALFKQEGASAPSPTTSGRRTSLGIPEREPLAKPEKSLLSGATSKEQAEYMRKIKEEVYRRHNIES